MLDSYVYLNKWIVLDKKNEMSLTREPCLLPCIILINFPHAVRMP